jgi:hypothetical protein
MNLPPASWMVPNCKGGPPAEAAYNANSMTPIATPVRASVAASSNTNSQSIPAIGASVRRVLIGCLIWINGDHCSTNTATLAIRVAALTTASAANAISMPLPLIARPVSEPSWQAGRCWETPRSKP